MNTYYVSLLPFFKEAFVLEAIPKDNHQWLWNWRSAYFYHTDRYSIVSMNLTKIQRPHDLYNIIWTNFKSIQTFLDFETYICWDRTIVAYCRTLHTKVIIKQICFTRNSETSWLPTNNGGISGTLVPFTKFLVFSNSFLGLF